MQTASDIALEWYRLLYQGDMAQAWPAMTDRFRLAVTQSVLHRAREAGDDVEELVEDLRSLEPLRLDRFEFWSAAQAQLLRVAGHLDPTGLALASRPRPLSAHLELIVLVRVDSLKEATVLQPGETAQAVRVLVAWEDGTPKVAGLEYLLEPGWPPRVSLEPPPEE